MSNPMPANLTPAEIAKCREERGTLSTMEWALKYSGQLLAAAERCEVAENEARVLKHSESLTADALKQFATDCSTPTFQLARNAAERCADAEKESDRQVTRAEHWRDEAQDAQRARDKAQSAAAAWRAKAIEAERELAIAGVRGSPPPGVDTTIGKLQTQSAAWRACAERLAEALQIGLSTATWRRGQDYNTADSAIAEYRRLAGKPTNNHFAVRFHGGAAAGDLRVYPSDPGPQIVLPCENNPKGIIYERDESEIAQDYRKRTGEQVYRCVYNGAATRRLAGKEPT